MPDNVDLELIKITNKANAMVRRERLQAISEYIGFGVSKLTGFASLTVGIMELANPDFHPVKIMQPEAVFALGLSLLAGPKIISLFAKVLNSIKES